MAWVSAIWWNRRQARSFSERMTAELKQRILVVDDNDAGRYATSRLLPEQQPISDIAKEASPHVKVTMQPDAGLG